MNDREISDLDKLKNLLIEFGIDAIHHTYHDGTSLVSIEGQFADLDFWFTSENKFEEVMFNQVIQ